MMRRSKTSISGFTLIELIIVVVIVAILAAFAAPSYRSLVMGNKVRGVTEELVSAIAQARAEAVTRKRPVSLCRSENGTTCSAAGNWRSGFIMYVDEKAETSEQTEVGAIIGRWTNLPFDVDLTLTRGATSVNFVRYTNLGTLARVDNNSAIFLLNVEGCNGSDNQRRISIPLSGIQSIAKEACPNPE